MADPLNRFHVRIACELFKDWLIRHWADGYALKRALLFGDTMATGIVKWFNQTKGFGFITPSDGGKDVFVHVTAVQKAGLPTLTEGQQVTYDMLTERGRTVAGNLKVG